MASPLADLTKTKIDADPHEWIFDDWPHGDTFSILFENVEDEDGNTVDLSSGYEAEMRFEEKDGTELVTLTHLSGITLGNGTLEIETETEAWPQNCTAYSDFQVITPGGNTETWFRIIVKLKRSITLPV